MVERKDRDLASEASLTKLAIASVLDKRAGTMFKEEVKKLNDSTRD